MTNKSKKKNNNYNKLKKISIKGGSKRNPSSSFNTKMDDFDKREQTLKDNYFKDNQHSSYLFIVFGLFIGAALTKFNVLS
tara:strand:- start:1077 stop:1316 length:240 start_codon:yes stop_codon:yes gene_type:complete